MFFFKKNTAYEMRVSDWSSDLCSSVLLLAQVYVELTGGRQIGLDLSLTGTVAGGKGVFPVEAGHVALARPYRPARPHAPTLLELERHAAFLTRLTDALWQPAGLLVEYAWVPSQFQIWRVFLRRQLRIFAW